MPETSHSYIEYAISLAQEFESRMDRMGLFIDNHNVSRGSSKETMLREFLARHAPKSHYVGEGFIYEMNHPHLPHRVSRQCDILVYDQIHYPVVYEDGSIKLVYPDSVAMMVEVKTHLNKGGLDEAIENILASKRLRHRFSALIFAFNSPNLETTLKNIEARIYSRAEAGPVAILLFDKGVIIHCWHYDYSQRPDWTQMEVATYKVVHSKNPHERRALVVAFLLLLFLQSTAHYMSAEFIGALGGLLNNYGDEIHSFDIPQER